MLKRYLRIRRLKATMRPDPEYRERRLAQFIPERRERYWRNVQAVYDDGNYKRTVELMRSFENCFPPTFGERL